MAGKMTDQGDQQLQLDPPPLETKPSTTTATAGYSASTAATKTKAAPSAETSVSGAIPMTMPSILRNSSLSQSNHLSYVLDRSSSSSYPPTSSRNTRSRLSNNPPQLGRRKQRRSENARLLSNPHVVRPSIKDYRLHSNEIRSTSFPTDEKSTSLPVPSSSRFGYSEPVHDAEKANQGHFGASLKDAQRVLRRLEVDRVESMVSEGKAGELERFVWLVEREIRLWSEGEVHVFSSDQGKDRKVGKVLLDEGFQFTQSPFHQSDGEQGQKEEEKAKTVNLDTVRPGQEGQLIEFQRTPNALVWLIHDPFLRLVVHCLARVSKCPSFSKDDLSRPGLRFTWILNRNPLSRRSRRNRRASVSSSTADPILVPAARTVAGRMLAGVVMDTPPTTDFDSQTESELGADTDTDASDLGGSLVIVPPLTHQDPETEGDRETVDTDEDEAEILRRVRRWAIDSHRQRAERERMAEAESRDSSPLGTRIVQSRPTPASETRPVPHDPDATLTAHAIAEEDDYDDEDDVEDDVLSLSDT